MDPTTTSTSTTAIDKKMQISEKTCLQHNDEEMILEELFMCEKEERLLVVLASHPFRK